MLSKEENISQLKKPMEDDSVTVYVWSTGLNTLGHVSLKLNDDSGHYWSIWPKSTPAGGFTSIWPLKATLATKLEEDCMQEAIRPSADFANLMQPAEILPLEPDKVFVVHGIDKQKVKNELDRIKEGLDTGNVSYQLLPGVKAYSFINSWIFGNPKDSEVYNCVTLTGHLLEVGGKSFNNTPWATPSNFAEQLSNLDQVKLLNPSVTETVKPSMEKEVSDAESGSGFIRNRLTNRWFSDDFDNATTSQEAINSNTEIQEPVSSQEDIPSPRVSESSVSFFSNGSQSFLQRRDEEADLSYIQRLDGMLN